MVPKLNSEPAESRGAEAPVRPPEISLARPRPIWPDALDALAVESPARRLQIDLERSLAAAETRWSPRRALAFMVLTSAAGWTALILSARALF